ncbi:hypothetical protein B0H14DRAFT_2241135, partial [Mycena olivaceomarginata]
PLYGYEYIAQLSARFITVNTPLCLHTLSPAIYPLAREAPVLYCLHRTKLHQAVTYAALVLLQRLKARLPAARGSSGHRLFICAFMIASKVICDDTYSNKAWSIAAQGMFTLRQIDQMEREICNYLDRELAVDNLILAEFGAMVQRDFPPNSKEPYPTYSLHMVSNGAAKAAAFTSNS